MQNSYSVPTLAYKEHIKTGANEFLVSRYEKSLINTFHYRVSIKKMRILAHVFDAEQRLNFRILAEATIR